MVVSGLPSGRFTLRAAVAMIKLNESKLCIMMMEVMVVVARGFCYRGLAVLLVFIVFAAVDDEIIAKSRRAKCESKTHARTELSGSRSGAHELHIYLSHVPQMRRQPRHAQ